jgi:hypothetical protein
VGEFVQAAAIAGWADPALLEGVGAALRAYHLLTLGELGEAEEQDVNGDALNLCDTNMQLRLVVLLEEMIAELADRAAAIFKTERDDPVRAAFRGMNSEHLRRTDHRARRARERAAMAEADLSQLQGHPY